MMLTSCCWKSKHQARSGDDFRKQVLVVAAATMTVFTTGINLGWSSPSVPKLLSSEYQFDLTSDEVSNILVIGFVGDIIGGFLNSYLIDRVGRQKTMLILSVPQVVSFLLIYFSYLDSSLLYISRVLAGLPEGAFFTLSCLYASEISSPQVRGGLGILTSISYLLGVIFINTVGSYFSIHTTALICIGFPVVFMAICTRLPETPYYLLMKNRTEEAEATLMYLLNKPNVSKELEDLQKDVNRQMTERGSFKDLFTINSNKKAFFYMVVTRTAQQFSGCVAISFYAQDLMSKAISSMTPLLASSLMLLAQLLMTLVSAILVDRYGRKVLITFSSFGCFSTLLSTAAYFTVRDYLHVDTSSFEYLPLVFIVSYQVFYASGLQCLVNLLISEMFNQTVKANATSLLNVVFSVTAPLSVKYYQVTSELVGMAMPFYSFALCIFLGGIFFAIVLPETKRKTLEEIQQYLKGNSKDEKAVRS